MKTLKVLGIIGIVTSLIGVMCGAALYESANFFGQGATDGWVDILFFFALAQSIVMVVQAGRLHR
jgi:hypothetical protein